MEAGAPARGEYKSGIIKQFRGNRNKTRKSKFQSFSSARCVGEIARGRYGGVGRWLMVGLALAFGKPLQTTAHLLNRALLFSCRRVCVSCAALSAHPVASSSRGFDCSLMNAISFRRKPACFAARLLLHRRGRDFIACPPPPHHRPRYKLSGIKDQLRVS